MRIVCLAFFAMLLLPAIGLSESDEKASDRPKEAPIASIAEDVNPDVRQQIAELLASELERVQSSLEADEKKLDELRSQLKTQEAKVAKAKLTAKFLEDRLEQWQPKEESKEDDEEDVKEKDAKKQQDEVKP